MHQTCCSEADRRNGSHPWGGKETLGVVGHACRSSTLEAMTGYLSPAPATKPNDLDFIPRAHVVEGEN